MEKYIDAMIRQNLMQRQAERKKVDEIDIRQFPELTVNWVSGHKLRTETVSNDPAALADFADQVIARFSGVDFLINNACLSQDGVEVMVANSGYVLMARDMKYWKDVNEQLHQVMFAENRETVQNIEDGGMEMGRM